MSIVGDLERFASDLYPYRWPITIGFAVIVALVAAFAYRRGWHLIVARHKIASALAAAAVLAAVIPTGNYFLSPLWERSHLEEASPLAEAVGADATATPGDGDPTSASGSEPTAVSGREPAAAAGREPAAAGSAPTAASGSEPMPTVPNEPTATPGSEPTAPAFEPRVTHQGAFSGADDFHFGRGNALLIETAPGRYTLRFEEFSVRNGPDLFVYLTPAENSVDGAINLGDLRATDGAFNYEVPEGTDVSRFTHAIVWCREFGVLFASAPLAPA